jgi:hypothetical protein
MSKKKWQEKRNLRTSSYELPAAIREKIDDYASELEVPKSQLVTVLLIVGFDSLDNNRLDLSNYLKPSRSPLYRYVIDIDRLLEEYS